MLLRAATSITDPSSNGYPYKIAAVIISTTKAAA